ncbi:hypothetical protein J6590_036654 [Homalodisca vitripennis]|nr:hypothetical protein J6590_036654 [Homalodisca vitripennis]
MAAGGWRRHRRVGKGIVFRHFGISIWSAVGKVSPRPWETAVVVRVRVSTSVRGDEVQKGSSTQIISGDFRLALLISGLGRGNFQLCLAALFSGVASTNPSLYWSPPTVTAAVWNTSKPYYKTFNCR